MGKKKTYIQHTYNSGMLRPEATRKNTNKQDKHTSLAAKRCFRSRASVLIILCFYSHKLTLLQYTRGRVLSCFFYVPRSATPLLLTLDLRRNRAHVCQSGITHHRITALSFTSLRPEPSLPLKPHTHTQGCSLNKQTEAYTTAPQRKRPTCLLL